MRFLPIDLFASIIWAMSIVIMIVLIALFVYEPSALPGIVWRMLAIIL